MNSIPGLSGGSSQAISSVSSALTMNISSAESLFSNQLASALSTLSSSTLTSTLISDSQYFEDSISPATIRQYLTATSSSSGDPSNPQNIPNLLRGMKWLLASMSKGRNVSDFFPHVVKLVGTQNLEVRKMVYTYLVHYANYDSNCRELALLSINAFQRGLSDGDSAWIRASALRVLTSIHVSDVLQIQILGVKKCIVDSSPYVRKCAANALCKLYPRISSHKEELQRELVDECWTKLIGDEGSVMVLSSCMLSFSEMCPDRLELLHPVYRKLCHLLTDMDEWGQIVTIEILSRYCRTFFRKPGTGQAEIIDANRNIRRKMRPRIDAMDNFNDNENVKAVPKSVSLHDAFNPSTTIQQRQLTHYVPAPTKVKRRVVRKGFYSDEEDESTEEEVYLSQFSGRTHKSLASAMRQENVLGMSAPIPNVTNGANTTDGVNNEEDDHALLAEDHKLLLQCSLPLLKSRNAGVVLAVCSLHYYCGVGSVGIRSAIGKALVRIYHDRREIQYVVLRSIKGLIYECPSAFTPFLNDFFVKAMDPSFTRLIKLDILTALALEPHSINAVLNELRAYISHEDKTFVCAAIQAVGRLVEVSRVVYGRVGVKNGGDFSSTQAAIKEANTIALNCLHGLITLSECSENEIVVQECVMVIQLILSLLLSSNLDSHRPQVNLCGTIEDPNQIQSMAVRRLLLLVIRSLSNITLKNEDDSVSPLNKSDVDDQMNDPNLLMLKERTIALPSKALAPAIWVLSEWFTKPQTTMLTLSKSEEADKNRILAEVVRLLACTFIELDPCLKLQCVHFATKLLIVCYSNHQYPNNCKYLCEYILSLGRIDVNPDVRDRARHESSLLHLIIGLSYETENLVTTPMSKTETVGLESVYDELLHNKPTPSWLPIETDTDKSIPIFRFGTLSNMVSHKAGSSYLALPTWAEKDSPKDLRDPPQSPTHSKTINIDHSRKGKKVQDREGTSEQNVQDFSSSSESSESEETSSSSEDESESSSTSSETDSDESSGQDKKDLRKKPMVLTKQPSQTLTSLQSTKSNIMPLKEVDTSSEDESETSSSATESSFEVHSDSRHITSASRTVGHLLDDSFNTLSARSTMHSVSSLANGLEGLVMSPIVTDAKSAQITSDHDRGAWMILLRHEIAGGLSVMVRSVRGGSRVREARLVGLITDNPTVLVFELKFENKRTDDGLIRRVRVNQRSIGSHGTIAIRQLALPQEITVLKPGEMSNVHVAMEFMSLSTREGAMVVRLDIKSDRGSFPVEIRPPLEDLLAPLKINEVDFEKTFNRYHGVHHKCECSFNTPEISMEKLLSITERIMTNVNMVLVSKSTDSSGANTVKLAGVILENNQQVLVIFISDSKRSVNIKLCCEDAMVLHSLLSIFKKAFVSAIS